MTRNSYLTVLAAALVVVAALAGATAPAAAASDDSNDGLFTYTVEKVTPDGWMAKASAALDGIGGIFSGVDLGDVAADALGNEPSPTKQATELKTFLNEHNASFTNHTNQVLDKYNASVSNTTYVLNLTVVDEVDEPTASETIYLVASANGENVTEYEVVNETNKTVDRKRVMDSFTAEDLNADVRAYYESYVKPGEIPEKGYYISKYGKYGDISEVTIKKVS